MARTHLNPAAASHPVLPLDLDESVRRALAEDVGGGDLTAALLPPGLWTHATVITREAAVICGIVWFDSVFRELDMRITVAWAVADGDAVTPGQTLCTLQGPARAILTGERTALNFLQTLSGTATTTRHYVEAIAGTGAQVLDTRKTLPGLRAAQKYAVRCGGGCNHRMGLYDGVLIKENHILTAGSVGAAIAAARRAAPGRLIEVEVENMDELRQALNADADIILLDNFDVAALRDAVIVTAGGTTLEASGGITLTNIRAVADTGVDYISIGALTKDLRAIDLSMRIQLL